MTDTAVELAIPHVALDRLCMLFTNLDDVRDDADGRERFRAVSAPVVAAELRRLADDHEAQIDPANRLPEPHTLAVVVTRLRARADELDPPSPKET